MKTTVSPAKYQDVQGHASSNDSLPDPTALMEKLTKDFEHKLKQQSKSSVKKSSDKNGRGKATPAKSQPSRRPMSGLDFISGTHSADTPEPWLTIPMSQRTQVALPDQNFRGTKRTFSVMDRPNPAQESLGSPFRPRQRPRVRDSCPSSTEGSSPEDEAMVDSPSASLRSNSSVAGAANSLLQPQVFQPQVPQTQIPPPQPAPPQLAQDIAGPSQATSFLSSMQNQWPQAVYATTAQAAAMRNQWPQAVYATTAQAQQQRIAQAAFAQALQQEVARASTAENLATASSGSTVMSDEATKPVSQRTRGHRSKSKGKEVATGSDSGSDS